MPQLLSYRSSQQLFQGISYEEVKPGKAPIPIVSAPRPSSAHLNLHPSLRFQEPPHTASTRSSFDDIFSNKKRDSGYANSIHTDSNGKSSNSLRSSQSLKKSQSLRKSKSLPRFSTSFVKYSPPPKFRLRKLSERGSTMESSPAEEAPKLPELLLQDENLASLSLEDLSAPGNMEFSKRGSLYIGGQKLNELATSKDPVPRRVASSASVRGPPRIMTPDEESLSQRVRSMYEIGSDNLSYSLAERLLVIPTEPADTELTIKPVSSGGLLSPDSASIRTSKRASLLREDQELAGGIEDWQDIRNEDVDRYGFIRPETLPDGSHDLLAVPQPGIHRVATSLQLASDTPRRTRSTIGRSPSTARSVRSTRSTRDLTDSPKRPVSSQSAYSPTKRISVMRNATNKLPHNKNRRYMDEAGDMLTLPPGAISGDTDQSPKASSAAKKKEWEREEKWRKMAKISRPNGLGGQTLFEFDPKDSKVISRTWKGIPDRWRATAWHSFLSASARRLPDCQTDAELIASFNELVDQASPDDVQIDLDVPRTISSHIMFRRRYRGGQRLLFRILHSLSLYFPATGYVQGMAALAATFLCYFDEEMAFVMLVRLWQTRGLDKLYEEGFAGLMNALGEFETNWLAGGVVHSKLTELGITPTAYATRWFLTLFNYTIPFPAQLRIWDVFLLLGDADQPTTQTTASTKADSSFHGGLDVLHASSAALIDSMRDILLEADFEEAMKALTSWIPIQDNDLLMRVTRAELKVHRRKK